MKDICIITNYFPPETGAASNRIVKLALGLKERGFAVKVICPLPNYPKGKIFENYQGKWKLTENYKGVEVTRLWVYANNSSHKVKRLLSMVSFSLSLIIHKLLQPKDFPNKILIQSPPLIIANTALRLFSNQKRQLILNVSDLWPSAGYELGALKKGRFYELLEKMEVYNYKKANLVLGQSQEILERVTSIFPQQQIFLYRNYPAVSPQNDFRLTEENNTVKLVYAGLLGIAQGIVKLCQHIELGEKELHIYGAGAEKEALEDYLKTSSKNIYYHGEVTREKLLKELSKYHIALVPLVHAIYGSTPSKIYEMTHNALPILYFAGGEGENVIKEFKLGYVITPGDFKSLNTCIAHLEFKDLENIKPKILEIARTHFNIEKQLDDLAKTIV
ncbi:glycosyltransferase involved in cell wall biosynthesis [Mesonia algae]|uniref:Glycosyltransferase involved in cell wall biosynthesis n=1 Tax=Mesonia algae TaxID=213248 RepID=A0A2W7K9E2_9FLAO|nr:glycosyltransferase family 4 protein [Mesonia algae]PZW44220.1 glycosyltransferase involved in cell wall biosynthesis [Mesonia algae]